MDRRQPQISSTDVEARRADLREMQRLGLSADIATLRSAHSNVWNGGVKVGLSSGLWLGVALLLLVEGFVGAVVVVLVRVLIKHGSIR
jgi:hypothetical protein